MGNASSVIRGVLPSSDSKVMKTVRLSPVLARVWLKLLEEYTRRNSPIPASDAAEIVRANSNNQKNPFSMLNRLDMLGVLQLAAGNAKKKARIPLTIGIVVFLVRKNFEDQQIWPVVKKEEESVFLEETQAQDVSDAVVLEESVSVPVASSCVLTKEELEEKRNAKRDHKIELLSAWRATISAQKDSVAEIEESIKLLESSLVESRARLIDAQKTLSNLLSQNPEDLPEMKIVTKECEDLNFVLSNYDKFTAHLLRE